MNIRRMAGQAGMSNAPVCVAKAPVCVAVGISAPSFMIPLQRPTLKFLFTDRQGGPEGTSSVSPPSHYVMSGSWPSYARPERAYLYIYPTGTKTMPDALV